MNIKLIFAQIIFLIVACNINTYAQAQKKFIARQVSFNIFRNPSIGFEYHRFASSVHVGYYVTNFKSNETTEFLKAGFTQRFLPWGKYENPSSLYVGASYLRGLTREYRNKNAIGLETGMQLTIWEGLNFRLGAIALLSESEEVKINPTPGFSYTIKLH